MRERGEAVEEARRRHGEADAGLLREEAGDRRGIARVLLVAERDHAHALGLRHAREVGDRDAGQAEDRVDAVQLQRLDDQVEAVDRLLRLRGGRHVLVARPARRLAQTAGGVTVAMGDVLRGMAPGLRHGGPAGKRTGESGYNVSKERRSRHLDTRSSSSTRAADTARMTLLANHPERPEIREHLQQNIVAAASAPAAVRRARAALAIDGLPQGRRALEHQGAHEMEQYFVLDGILKRVVANPEGKEMILRFAEEDDMDTSYAAWRLQTPAPYSIRARHQVRASRSCRCRSGSSSSNAHPELKKTSSTRSCSS